jgi:anion-transporting  ArsA/GET3 family ATPase
LVVVVVDRCPPIHQMHLLLVERKVDMVVEEMVVVHL